MKGRNRVIHREVSIGIIVVVLWTLLLVPACLGATGTVLEQTDELKSGIEVAMFLAKSALLSPNQTDLALHASELVNLLQGRTDTTTPTAGMIVLGQSIEAELTNMEQDGTATLEAVTSSTLIVSFLHRALEHARLVLSSSGNDAVEAMQRVYANLLAAYGLDDSQFSIPGISALPSLLPNVTVTVEVGDSIQDAIDRVLPGGTVYLAAGVHTVHTYIEIRKSLTLKPLPGAEGAVMLGSSGDTTWNSGVIIRESDVDELFTVVVSNLEIAGSGNGVSVDANAIVELRDLTIHNCSRSGISVTSGTVRIVGCSLSESEVFGLALNGTADVDLVRTSIQSNGTRAAQAISTLVAGVYVVDSAKLSMSAATIQSNYGPGILVQDEAELVLTSSLVSDNRGDGLLASDVTTLHIAGTGFLRNEGAGIHFQSPACPIEAPLFVGSEFTGRVTGSSNRSFDASAADGNLSGGICPSGYEGLLH